MDPSVDGTSEGGIQFDPSGRVVPPVIGPPVIGHSSSGPSFAPPIVTVVPAKSVGKRSNGKVVGGLVAVLALLGAGGFAVTKIVAGNDGGAASPSEVGTRLMDALSAEDALGVVDLLLPGERDTLRQPLIDLVDNLKRLGVADNTADLEKIGGFDISFQDVQVGATPTNVDDVSDIDITATGRVSVDGRDVPIGQLLIDEAFGGNRPDLGSDPSESAIDWKLATVKRDGRWYLSAFYSIAESVRADGQDIPENPIVARGADTPEGAVQAIFDAVDDLDLEALIAALNPNETEALQRYAPMFIDDAQSSLDKLDANIAFSDTKFTVTGSGDRRTVSVDGFKMHFTGNDQDITVESKGGCVVVDVGDTKTDSCAGGSSIDSTISALGLDDNEDVQALIKTVRDAFSDLQPVGLTVQKVDGKWYLSPIGTEFDAMLTVMAALDKGELTDIIDGIKKVAQSVSTEGIFGGTTETSTSAGGDSTTSDGFEACYQESGYSAFASCIATGLDDGSIDPSSVPPYFRFADCGVGEQYFSGDVYTMSDDDFIAFATAAAPCFQQHVTDGSVSQFELPYELSRPDCLEGKNWYNVSDSDYNDRVFECAT